jgi:hypothetical protein
MPIEKKHQQLRLRNRGLGLFLLAMVVLFFVLAMAKVARVGRPSVEVMVNDSVATNSSGSDSGKGS